MELTEDQIDQQVACHECDALLDLKPLTKGQRAVCPRCGGLIQAARDDHLTRALAFAIAGLLLLPIANAYPFLSFGRSGLENMFRLPQAVQILFDNGAPGLSVIVLVLIMVLPAMLLAIELSLVIPLLLAVWWFQEMLAIAFTWYALSSPMRLGIARLRQWTRGKAHAAVGDEGSDTP